MRGTVSGDERLVGFVGPRMTDWGFLVNEERITIDLLAAVAFMHWKWSHW
jgi:hypothetical protein